MMKTRQNISSGSIYEPIVGYSRAVRVGSSIFISGTTSFNEAGEIIGNDIYEQTMQILANIEKALKQSGAQLTDVVRTRMYVTDVDKWEEVGKAHAKFFKDIRPATTLVEVNRLVSPEMLIEIEADAVITKE